VGTYLCSLDVVSQRDTLQSPPTTTAISTHQSRPSRAHDPRETHLGVLNRLQPPLLHLGQLFGVVPQVALGAY
jgi:hypothetical protein